MACLVPEYLGETPFTHEFDGRHSSIRQTWTRIAEGEIAQFRKRSKALRRRPSRPRFWRLYRNSWKFISVNRVTRRPSSGLRDRGEEIVIAEESSTRATYFRCPLSRAVPRLTLESLLLHSNEQPRSSSYRYDQASSSESLISSSYYYSSLRLLRPHGSARRETSRQPRSRSQSLNV